MCYNVEKGVGFMNINILLFDDFESLDAFGPVEVFGCVDEYKLRYVSMDGGIIKSRQQAPVMTEKLILDDFSGLLLIPGGQGSRPLSTDETFICELKNFVDKAEYCLTVCTGSVLLAKTGCLDNRKATSNKRAFEWVKSSSSKVDWQEAARWVVDGKYYTSSGVSAGIDMSLGFVADKLGREEAANIVAKMEYIWNEDKDKDKFSVKR